MTGYQQRLERVEAAIAPKEELIVLIVKDGQTREDALAACARARRVTAAEVRGTVVFFTEEDAQVL